MKTGEKRLFLELCKFKSETFDESFLEFATPQVLGLLFFNRMQAIAFDRMKKHGILSRVNREFRNSLKFAYEQNVEKNESFMQCIEYLSSILRSVDSRVAMLKGAYLCAYYPEGYRTSNDIDLLVHPEDVTKVGHLLSQGGFQQGSVQNDMFVPATRKEIIESKMMRGETVPYIKEVNLPYMHFLEVDINFSLDYKNGETEVIEDILSEQTVVEQKGILIPTLSKADFFIHLCAHLYKEATTLPWIEMKRDMTLYKYADIYLLMTDMSEADMRDLFARAIQLGMEKILSYVILETVNLFEMDAPEIKRMAERVLIDCPLFLTRVVAPKEKKVFYYKTEYALDRFFLDNRIDDLKEVNEDEKIENEK